MKNEDLIQSLKGLPKTLSDKDKINLLKILKDIKNYIIGYEPEMWDITIQGVLLDLFWDINKQPMILNLDTERNWQNVKTTAYDLFNNSEPKPKIYNLIENLALTNEDTEFIDSIVSMYNERTGINGNMRYIPKEPIGVYAENDKRTAEMVQIEIDLSERNFEWFIEYYDSEIGQNLGIEKKYIELYKDFFPNHISDVKLEDFVHVLKHKNLHYSRNGKKINWISKKNQCFWFGKYAGFDNKYRTGVAEINKCFESAKGGTFNNSLAQEQIDSEFENLLKKHFPEIPKDLEYKDC